MHGFDNRIIAHAEGLKILPSIVKFQTIVAGVLDVAGDLRIGCFTVQATCSLQ